MQCYVQKNSFLICRRNIRLRVTISIDSFLYATAENPTNGVKFWLTSTLLSTKKHSILRPKLRNKLKLMHFFRLIKNQLFIATAFLPFFLQAFLSITYLHYRTRAIIGRSRFEAALVYKPRILSLKNEEFPFLVHKLSVI